MPSALGRRIALAAMAAALAVYVVLHSPLRDPIAMVFGQERRTCYFCLPPLTGFDLPDSLAAGALLLLAAVAAWAVAERCSWPAYERVLLFGLATVALVTVPAAIIGGLASLFGGTYLRPPAGLLLAAIPALALIVARGREGWRPSPPPVRGLLDTPLLRTIAAAASLLLVAEVTVTLLHPPLRATLSPTTPRSASCSGPEAT